MHWAIIEELKDRNLNASWNGKWRNNEGCDILCVVHWIFYNALYFENTSHLKLVWMFSISKVLHLRQEILNTKYAHNIISTSNTSHFWHIFVSKNFSILNESPASSSSEIETLLPGNTNGDSQNDTDIEKTEEKVKEKHRRQFPWMSSISNIPEDLKRINKYFKGTNH